MDIHQREDCPVCCGDGELDRNGLDGVTAATIIKHRVAGLYKAARRALELARVYVADCAANGWTTDSRIENVLATVRAYRMSIRYHRRSHRLQPWERLAWCAKCRGLGLADNACEDCGDVVDMASVDVLVHRGCTTGHRHFDHEQATPRGENYWGSRDMREWRGA